MMTLLERVEKGKGTNVDMAGRYGTLSSDRTGYLSRGRDYSRFTLPSVLPDTEGNRGDAGNQHGFQGTGAQVTNHLSNKLTLNMFPINRSFFKAEFSEATKKLLTAADEQGATKYDITALSELLVSAEKSAEDYQTIVGARVGYTEAFKNLLISGNVCVHLPASGNLQAIKLDRYCVARDLSGNMVELIIEQEKTFSRLSEEVQLNIKSLKGEQAPKPDDKIKLYTWVYRKNGTEFIVGQVTEDILIKDPEYIDEDQLPWIVLTWNLANNEHYGRGLVEDHAGDFYVIEFLSEAIAKGMVLMSDIKYLIKPGSVTDIDEVSTAPTGEWVFGNLDDIGILQLERFADFSPISLVLDEYKKRVGQAFMLNSAVRRDAERVTTVELKIDAQELETSLGGNYSLLAQTFLTPLAVLYLYRVNFPFPSGIIPNIVTGLAAFGRAGDLDKIYQFSELMTLPATWPEGVQKRVKWGVYSREVAASLSMKTPFLMSDDELAKKEIAERKAEAAAAGQEKLQDAAADNAPEIINAIGGNQ